jgi:hypothetical protein
VFTLPAALVAAPGCEVLGCEAPGCEAPGCVVAPAVVEPDAAAPVVAPGDVEPDAFAPVVAEPEAVGLCVLDPVAAEPLADEPEAGAVAAGLSDFGVVEDDGLSSGGAAASVATPPNAINDPNTHALLLMTESPLSAAEVGNGEAGGLDHAVGANRVPSADLCQEVRRPFANRASRWPAWRPIGRDSTNRLLRSESLATALARIVGSLRFHRVAVR